MDQKKGLIPGEDKKNFPSPKFTATVCAQQDGFSGLVVSMLASGTRVRGFKPGRSHWIFRASEKSSACLPSEGK